MVDPWKLKNSPYCQDHSKKGPCCMIDHESGQEGTALRSSTPATPGGWDLLYRTVLQTGGDLDLDELAWLTRILFTSADFTV